jgi:hypothetical protein
MQNEMMWNVIMKKYHIEEATWERIMVDTFDIAPIFNPQILDDIPTKQFTDLAYAIFYFGPGRLTLELDLHIVEVWADFNCCRNEGSLQSCTIRRRRYSRKRYANVDLATF